MSQMAEIRRVVKEYCKNAYEDCITLLGELVSCRSFSGQEKECADRLIHFFQRHNIACFRDRRGSLLAMALPDKDNHGHENLSIEQSRKWVKCKLAEAVERGQKILAYNAHMDVVKADSPEKWVSDPFSIDRREGNIYGRGTCDMKGALAAMSMAIVIQRHLVEKFSAECIVVGCFCTEEEAGEGLAFKELCEDFALRPDMVILGEPSKMQIARGQRGKLECVIETTGRCAHTSVPEEGESAVYKMARVLQAIESLDEAERQRHGTGEESMLKRSTIAATSLQSWPLSKSFVPDRATTYVIARLALNENLASITQKLRSDRCWPADAIIHPVIYDSPSYTGIISQWNSEHSAWETPENSDFLTILKAAFSEIFAHEPLIKIWPFSTDGVYSAGQEKIPTLGIGPGYEEMAHKENEWVSESEMLEALQLYSFFPFFRG